MKAFIDVGRFLQYLNPSSITLRKPALIALEVRKKEFTASLIVSAEQHYKEDYTLQFMLRFEHKKPQAEGIMQREFTIEHHPPGRGHHAPHVQIHVHGPAPDEKKGELWITLPLSEEGEYIASIEGFLAILEEVISLCQPGLEHELLNIKEVRTLLDRKAFLLGKIGESLRTKGIEYQSPDGARAFLTPRTAPRLLKTEQTLLPFFT